VKKALQIAALFVLKKGNSIILVRYVKGRLHELPFFYMLVLELVRVTVRLIDGKPMPLV